MEVPYFPVEEDEFDRCHDYIESLKGTLKQVKGLFAEDEDEVNNQWLDEIIQSVFTDGQKATFKIYSETFSKKSKVARGDVRSLFIEAGPVFKNKLFSYGTPERTRSLEKNQLSVPHSDDIMRKNSRRSDHKSRQFSIPKGQDHKDGKGVVGPCLVHHLGKNDLNFLRGLAETEILTIFRQNGGMKISRLQSKRKSKDTGVFGVHLQNLLDRDLKKHANIRVPIFVSTLILMLDNHVNEEGIMRVSGSLSRIKETVQTFETEDNYLSILQCLLPHDLSGLLKQFLRDLPSPLFTLNWLDAFCKALAITDDSLKLRSYQTLLCLLPDVNRATLQLVLGLLHKISTRSSHNKMSPENVSMTIGPSLFLSSESRNSSNLSELDSLGKFVGVTSYFLKHFDQIWNVPLLFLKQIRQLNIEKESNRKKKRSTERKGNSDQKKRSSDRKTNTSEHAENVLENVFIRSCHPDFPSICLKISNNMTVGDVLQKLNKFKEPHFTHSSSLFETGGNIDHKYLCSSTNMSEVLEENPLVKFYFCRQSSDSLIMQWPQIC